MNILITFGLMFILIITGSLLGKFFDIQPHIYMPFIIWGIALCIFNLFLEQNHENVFMAELKD